MRINSLAPLLLSVPAIAATHVKTFTGFGILFFVQKSESAITDGLLRLYRGDGDETDSTGNGPPLNGDVAYTDVLFPQSGTARKVFDFENGLNGLRGSSSGLPSGSNSRTMLGWIKPPDVLTVNDVNGDPIGYGRSSTNEEYVIDTHSTAAFGDPNRKYRVTLDVHGIDEGINPILLTTTTDWFHVVVTYDQASNTNAVYLNGQFLRSGTPSAIPNTNPDDPNASPPSRLFLGGNRSDSPTEADYKGMVADVAIYNRVITADEVTTIYTNDNWFTNASGGGDPHLVGFGGKHFTWQGSCDVVLLTSPPIEGNEEPDFHIHIRTRKVRKWSTIDFVAIKIGRDVAEIDGYEGKVFLNGSVVSAINTTRMSLGEAMTKKKKMIYNFNVDDDKSVEVTANTRTNMLYLSLNGNYSKETKGILGSPVNPGFYGRDGKSMDGNVNLFVEEWQVNDLDPDLFRTHRSPQYPEKCSYAVQKKKSTLSVRERRLKENKSVTMEEAVAACTIHSAGPLKEFCIDDVIQTGELEVADDKFYG